MSYFKELDIKNLNAVPVRNLFDNCAFKYCVDCDSWVDGGVMFCAACFPEKYLFQKQREERMNNLSWRV